MQYSITNILVHWLHLPIQRVHSITSPTMQASGKHKARRTVPEMEDQYASGLTFINISEPKQSKDESLRRSVRSNAMRTHWQKEKQKSSTRRARKAYLENGEIGPPLLALTAKGHDISPTGWDDPVVETRTFLQTAYQPLETRDAQDNKCWPACGHPGCNESRRISLPPLQQPVAISPKGLIGDGMSDPFNVYPSGSCLRYNSYLLNHCELPPLTLSVHSPPWQFSTHTYAY